MKKLLLLSLVAITMVSCSRFVLKSSGALNGSNLESYTSFKMQTIQKDELPKGVSDTDLTRLYRALGNELTKRGYKYVAGDGAADLTLHVGLSKKNHIETDVSSTGVGVGVGVGYGGPGPRPGFGGYNYYGATPYTHSYFGTSTSTTELVTDGILIVDLVDNSNNSHVFCAQLSAQVDGEQLILKDNELLAKAAAKTFKKFPVPVPKK